MASCFDVAKYILKKNKKIKSFQIESLLYYCQAVCLVYDEKSLFSERIEASYDGVIIPNLMYEYSNLEVETDHSFIFEFGDCNNLTSNEKEIIDEVLGYYGDKDSNWLKKLICSESPWGLARLKSVSLLKDTAKKEILKYYNNNVDIENLSNFFLNPLNFVKNILKNSEIELKDMFNYYYVHGLQLKIPLIKKKKSFISQIINFF